MGMKHNFREEEWKLKSMVKGHFPNELNLLLFVIPALTLIVNISITYIPPLKKKNYSLTLIFLLSFTSYFIYKRELLTWLKFLKRFYP